MTREERYEKLGLVNGKIHFYKEYRKKHKMPGFDLDDLLDSLYCEQYDLIYGTHLLEIKNLGVKISLLKSILGHSDSGTKKRIGREIKIALAKIRRYRAIDRFSDEDPLDVDIDSSDYDTASANAIHMLKP